MNAWHFKYVKVNVWYLKYVKIHRERKSKNWIFFLTSLFPRFEKEK